MLKVKSYNVFIFLSVLISIFIGARFSDVGTDTESYIRYFYHSSMTDGFYTRFEIGFSLLMQLISKSTLSVDFFFFVVALLITLTYVHVFRVVYVNCFLGERLSTSILTIFFCFLLFSGWYITATTNGLRQGLSLVFLYFSLIELIYNKKKVKFYFLFLISISFHSSSILIVPFIFLTYFRFRYIISIWAGCAVGYMLGLNEWCVKLFSDILNLPIYEMIKYYSLEKGSEELGGGLYAGFDMKFFVYTIFWPLLLLVTLKFKFRFKSKSADYESIYKLLSIYLILSLVYFVMGFGPFSNRFAFFSWLFIPIIQTIIIKLAFDLSLGRLLCTFVFFSSLIYFLYFRLDWLRLFLV